MAYIHAKDVSAPKDRWTLHRVLIDIGPEAPAYALGFWDQKRCIGTRWNGNDDNETGWPRIFTRPCWHILDDKLQDAVIVLLADYRDKIEALRFLNDEPI
jgi:hypothetical protein